MLGQGEAVGVALRGGDGRALSLLEVLVRGWVPVSPFRLEEAGGDVRGRIGGVPAHAAEVVDSDDEDDENDSYSGKSLDVRVRG